MKIQYTGNEPMKIHYTGNEPMNIQALGTDGNETLSSDIDLVAYGVAKNVTAIQLSISFAK